MSKKIYFYSKPLGLCSLFLTFFHSNIAIAQSDCIPSSSNRTSNNIRMLGHRSPCYDELPIIEPLIELDYVTTQDNPILFLQVEKSSPIPVTIALMDVTGSEQLLFKTTTIIDQTGIKAFAVAEQTINLRPNRSYVWYVVLECNKLHSAQNPRLEIPLVKIDNRCQNPSVEYYLNQKLWWDALALSYRQNQVLFERTLEFIQER